MIVVTASQDAGEPDEVRARVVTCGRCNFVTSASGKRSVQNAVHRYLSKTEHVAAADEPPAGRHARSRRTGHGGGEWRHDYRRVLVVNLRR